MSAEATNSMPNRVPLSKDDVQIFLDGVLSLPNGERLDPVLQRAVAHEENLRKVFATDRGHPGLADPFVGLLDVFSVDSDVWKVIGRPLVEFNDDEHFIMPLQPQLQKNTGTLSIVSNIHEFQQNWELFTQWQGVLSKISWDNVIAAGGSILACLGTFETNATLAERNGRYQTTFAASDLDFFIWGLTASQAKAKMMEIFEAVRLNCPWKVTCVRKPNVVSIHTLYPARPIQIVLRLYLSPAEVLAGFDVDSACFAYDGHRVWSNPRALASCIRQANTVDLTRRSPSYEIRLAKYAERGYEVYLPSLVRRRIDHSIFHDPQPPKRSNGLARLLVLERLYFKDPELLNAMDYPWKRALVQGAIHAVPGRKRRHDSESSDYDIMWLIPYASGWDARRIENAMWIVNDDLNSEVAMAKVNRRLHRHPFYAGSMAECMEGFFRLCPDCPSPIGEEEECLVAFESRKYIRGPLRFLEKNPGQQLLTGSFQPLDMRGWEDNAYGLGRSSTDNHDD